MANFIWNRKSQLIDLLNNKDILTEEDIEKFSNELEKLNEINN
jgi:hypothetical protein|tara:strand:- start:1308 stop:1436 length:129 start_codon:yes stop_codon:yes gene_type:complete